MTARLTKKQHEDVEQFLNLFADAEIALKKKLGRPANDPTGMKTLIDAYLAKNPYWQEPANRLRSLGAIRNLLTHQRSTHSGYPIAVAPFSLNALRQIRQHLVSPESVSIRYRKEVVTVSDQDSLASVLAIAFEKGFSQFPVLSDERFGGLITENEITRWLGRRTTAHVIEVNLAAVTVKSVLREKDPFHKGMQIFRFQKLNAPVEEAWAVSCRNRRWRLFY